MVSEDLEREEDCEPSEDFILIALNRFV